jgi:hypothetical protein
MAARKRKTKVAKRLRSNGELFETCFREFMDNKFGAGRWECFDGEDTTENQVIRDLAREAFKAGWTRDDERHSDR